MNLQQLEHFLVLVETRSFSRAAAKLHLTQPALSRSIHALEEAVGGRLLERDKGKTLTALGELALVRARRIRVELAELCRSATLLADYAGGSVRLGLGPTPTAILSLPLLREMMQRYPAVKLLLSGGTPEMQLQELRDGAVDALVVHRNHIPADPDLHLRFFPRTPLGFVVRAGHPWPRKARCNSSLAPLRGGGQWPRHERRGDASPERLLRASSAFCRGYPISVERYPGAGRFGPHERYGIFGVLQVAQPMIQRGELVHIDMRPALELSSQFVFVTLEGKTLPPALLVLRELCTEYMSGPAD